MHLYAHNLSEKRKIGIRKMSDSLSKNVISPSDSTMVSFKHNFSDLEDVRRINQNISLVDRKIKNREHCFST